MNKKHCLQTCIEVAKLKNGLCMSTTFISIVHNMLWQCEYEHQWWATLHKVKNCGRWCPKCAGNIKYTIDDCRKYAQKHNGECLDETYINNRTLMRWRCECSGINKISLHDLVNRKIWCLSCYVPPRKVNKQTLQDCIEWAASKHGRCLSLFYINCKVHMEWECEFGHQWKAPFDRIKTGNWCRICAFKTTKPQLELQKFIENLGISTRSNDREQINPYEIDIFIPEAMVGIEYCGLYWHGEKKSKKLAKQRHVLKLQKCNEKNIDLITIFEDEWINNCEGIKNAIRGMLNKNKTNINAGDCVFKIINTEEANDFYKKNWIKTAYGTHVGIYFEDKIIGNCTLVIEENSAMIKECIINSNYKITDIFTGIINILNIGRDFKINQLIVCVDNRWPNDIYNGFELIKINLPTCFYFSQKHVRYFRLTVEEIIKECGSEKKALSLGYDRIWDCGNSVKLFIAGSPYH